MNVNLTEAPARSHRAQRPHARNVVAVVAGSLALLAGLVLEYVPFYGSGHTIPQANAVCSGIGGLFLQGFAKAFAPKQASQISAGCSLATTAEHFIGPLIIGGLLVAAAGVVFLIRDGKADL